MKISKCGSKLLCAILIGAALGLPLSAEIYAIPTAYADEEKHERDTVNQNLLEDSQSEYFCALASMSCYDSELNDVVNAKLKNLGWTVQEIHTENKRADAKFSIFENTAKDGTKYTVVAIPGTMSLKDVEVDLRNGRTYFAGTTPEEFQLNADKDIQELALEQQKESGDFPTVHHGFNDYVQTAFFTKNETTGKMGVEYLQDALNRNDGKFYITGHSLGGAAAVIFAARLSAMGVPADRIHVITYGNPAIGNKTFADWCSNKFRYQRVVIQNDSITMALQSLASNNAVFTQFGEKVQWSRNENTHRNHHEMAVYLDAAIRNYQDIISGLPGSNNKPSVNVANKYSIWNGDNRNGGGYRVYIAPVNVNLHQSIQSDGNYMSYIVQEMLVDQLRGAVADNGEIRDLKDTLKEAQNLGCEYVIFTKVTGDLLKTTKYTCNLQLEETIYDVTGNMVFTQTNSTNSSKVTPLEAVMYDVVRGSESRRNSVQNKTKLQLGSIFADKK